MLLEIDKKTFNILVNIIEGNYTYQVVDKEIISSLKDNDFIDDELNISKIGLENMEKYKVKRAIFLAAGFGSRLVPITYNTPKPLILVNGKRMIDTLIDAVLAAGIEEIIVVRGYLKENFDVLLHKYPMIKFIDNDNYSKENNISSAILVKDYLSNSLIMESDLILSNPSIIKKYEYETNYRGIKVSETDDWAFRVVDDKVEEVMIGGKNVHQMIGISFWSSRDADNLSKDLTEVYSKEKGKQLFWDEVALKVFKEDYSIKVNEIQINDIVEIDSYVELCEVDKKYAV